MIRFVSSRLSVKICLQVIGVAIPLLAVAVWQAAASERESVREMLIDRGRVAALSGAAAYAAVLESGISSGALTLKDVLEPPFDPDHEIHYPFFVEGKRYNTRLGDYTDSHGIGEIEDAILASSPDLLYASAMQLGGYVPTPHGRYNKKPTGDLAHDRAFARAKLKYEEGEPVSAASYDGQLPTQVLPYQRNTGDAIWDVVAPIHVQGKHWGGFRVGVRKDQVEARAGEIELSLSVLLGAAVAAMGGLVLLVTRRTTRPLVELAHKATRLSTDYDGSELHVPVCATTRDEVGDLARALNRMRLSMVKTFQLQTSGDQARVRAETGRPSSLGGTSGVGSGSGL